jgi:hypothetical protein
MTDKTILWAGGVCSVASAVPFWLWKLSIITGPSVHALVWLFVALFGLFEVFGFVLGGRPVFRMTRSWAKRGLLVVGLLGGLAYVALMAALEMNFVGQGMRLSTAQPGSGDTVGK